MYYHTNCWISFRPTVFVLQGLERELAEGGSGVSEDAKKESIMRLSWGLVHSRRPEDVQRGVAMLEG